MKKTVEMFEQQLKDENATLEEVLDEYVDSCLRNGKYSTRRNTKWFLEENNIIINDDSIVRVSSLIEDILEYNQVDKEHYLGLMLDIFRITQLELSKSTGVSLSSIKNISTGRTKITKANLALIDNAMTQLSEGTFNSFNEFVEFIQNQENSSIKDIIEAELEDVDAESFIYLFYVVIKNRIYLVDIANMFEFNDANDVDTQELISEYPYIVTRLKDAYDLSKILSE